MSSTVSSSPCNRHVEAFLEGYNCNETQRQFKNLADLVRRGCEDLLETKRIKGVVQSRSKNYNSLKKKLNDMAETPEFIKWISGEATEKPDEDLTPMPAKDVGKHGEKDSGGCMKRDIYEHPDMGDLAGVRIGLYFPGDVLRVADGINKLFDVSHTFGTVTDTTRSAVTDRNRDTQKHGNGRWYNQGSDGKVHHFEHYGYKSWQVVVGLKRPLPKEASSIEEVLAAKGFISLKVEVQVGTVVTQAWAEVQHNIIYKRSSIIRETPTMMRMIDAINGLAITTDIMLNELERCQKEVEREVEERRRLNSPESRLRRACRDGNAEEVDELIEQRINLNEKGDGGYTPIFLASIYGHDRILGRLINAGAKVDDKDHTGMTPLQWASREGHHRVAEKLIKGGARVEGGGSGLPPLQWASREGHHRVAEKLIKGGAMVDGCDVDALETATMNGHARVVEELIKGGAKVNAERFIHPLRWATRNGDYLVVEQLLKARPKLDGYNIAGLTPFPGASKDGFNRAIMLLYAAKAQEPKV